jgi:hypothetical protein
MLRLDARALRSQVAQHIFLVFVACSMLPVAAFALFAFWQVRSQLEADARVTLRHASKTAGMSILERLMLADEELKVLVDQSGASAAKGPMAPRAGARIQSVEHWAPARVETLLSGRQREHLDSGYSVVWVDSQDGPPARVHLLRRGASSTTWAA